MGFCLTWLKIARKSRDDIFKLLGVVPTGEDATDFHDGLSGRLHADGSYLFVASNDEVRHLDQGRLAALSADGDIVVCHVHEGSMTSFASGWKDGQEIWHVAHDSGPGAPQLDVAGSPPAILSDIKRLKEDAQRAELSRPKTARPRPPSALPSDLVEVLGRFNSVSAQAPVSLSMCVNHRFDVPVALCESLVGFKHDSADCWRNSPFEILAPKA